MRAFFQDQWLSSKNLLAFAFAISWFVPAPEVRAGENSETATIDAKRLVERTQKRFLKARFNKAGGLDPSKTAHEFAPLIVENADPEPPARIGTFSHPLALEHPVRPDTIYFDVSSITVNDQQLEQVVYLWWYGKVVECKLLPIEDFIQYRGVRILLGPDGTPVIWEALSNGEEARVFFVAQSLETSALRQFGPPLPGRSFSIENTLVHRPKTAVAKVLDDGPVPMGPYVYVDSPPTRNITTVLCRCMDSQFDEAVETVEYALEPLESLDKKWFRETAKIDLDRLIDPGPLDKLFRWPKD